MCLPCAEAKGLSSGDITGKSKVYKGKKGMLPLPLGPNTRVFTQMSTTPVGQKRMLLLWR